MSTFQDRHRSDFDWTQTGFTGSFADILWRDQAGHNVVWFMNNNTPSTMTTLLTVTPDWHFKAAAEFNIGLGQVGNADILWQNDNGALAIWSIAVGIGVIASHPLPNPGPAWHVVGDNDFNGDDGDDIFFQNDNGAVALWTITSAATGTVSGMFAGTQNPGPAWHVVGTGDTDGDARAGVLWQNNNGALVLWENPTFGAGTVTFNTTVPLQTVDASWHVKGMADLNGDNRADIVFQNDNGSVVVWEMGGAAGTTINAMDLVNLSPGPAWHIAGLGNMDGVGGADIVFQNDNGAAAVWEGFSELGGGSATFNTVALITPNPNPNGHVWDLL